MMFQREIQNTEELCRLCLEKNNFLISVFDFFEESYSSIALLDKIYLCLHVQICRTDKASKKICSVCLDKVESFYEFYNKTAESQKFFTQWEYELVLQEQSPSVRDVAIQKFTSNREQDETIAAENGDEFGENCVSDNTSLEKIELEDDRSKNKTEPLLLDYGTTVPGTSSDNSAYIDPLREVTEMENFSQKGDLIKPTNLLTCGDCDIQFRNVVTMKKHIKEKHSSFICGCGAKFSCLRYLTRHEIRHNTKPSIPCKLCNKLFLNNSEVKEHQKSHQVGERITCELCEYVTLYKSNMSRHMKRHNKDYLLFCEICSEGCYSKDELETHHIKKHNGTPFLCKTCNKNFTSRGYLYEHNKITHWITTKDYLCETCGKAFKTKSATKKHMKIHEGLKFTCHICSKTLNSAYSLKKHLKVHTGIKNIVCYICGKAFVDKKYMAAHLRSHTGERPYSCNECGKKFTQATTLKVHKRYHTGERPYICQICGSGFVTNTLLTSHLKTHSQPA